MHPDGKESPQLLSGRKDWQTLFDFLRDAVYSEHTGSTWQHRRDTFMRIAKECGAEETVKEFVSWFDV